MNAIRSRAPDGLYIDLPYKPRGDEFLIESPMNSPRSIRIEEIPPMLWDYRGIHPPVDQVALELNNLTKDSTEKDIISCFQKCHTLGFNVDAGDINERLARFAICRNAVTLLRYLVEEKKVPLDTPDGKGRTPIFYAILWDSPDNHLFEYLTPLVPQTPQSLQYHRDHSGRTALEYAIAWQHFHALDFLLGLSPDFKITDGIADKMAAGMPR
ncbi:hypothetical protein F4777DRAFT_320692 [Nemania sp. FL0916]|nr:hypothetical protein F4777DRAFT_320692 [Nemania sp. FL0916]